ncbi:sigma-54-dependent Fis family transcriptional regulator [Bordetella genomosp. 1]|uniref:Sigma-54-dependent Fis family transcriptional regulator n=1 Tax=Bordetella genomosp. 1 TaxID=1395607 RepID=A0A261S6F4_9BORD|nr:sigma-54-dependent Fis family transcriptional regulator [Bordetella genomosp. 1]OZI32948.1 sigma-54-dependent Fis family transcriptional regulator [Bordetella genomosp. 1]
MAMSASSQAFADPAAESRIRRAWEAVLSGAPVPGGGGLRGLIERSWHRCVRARVDPGQFGGPQPLAPAEFERLRALHGDLLQAGAPVLDHAQGVLAGFGCLVTLSDSASVILAAAGEARVLDAGRAIHLMPGVDWSESHCGTNAIGTALAAAGPVQVHSAEHFCEGIKRWTCSAALIRDPAGGGPVGVLDVSGLSDTYSRHNLAFAVMSARHIESRLAALDIERRHRLVEAVRGQWRRAGDALGAILLDGRGFLVSFNAAAQRALARAGADIVLERTHAMPGFAPGEGRGAAELPPWARPEWVEPVFLDGVRQGTLLLLPAAPALTGATVEKDPLAAVITEDPAVRVLVAQARQLRESDTAVLLVGETGVGKELFARGLHRAGPFVVLNCGGLSRELLASELFGYADGAFTGARKGGMPGKIEAAAGGTLFLDEIGEMPLDMQTYLLRVLEQREVCRLGENAPRPVRFRLLAATHRDLAAEIDAGHFRLDLYYRIAVVQLQIPALRERKGDIALLARAFATRFQQEQGKLRREVGGEVLDVLAAYPWPGNIRELRNAVESAVALSHDGVVRIDRLPAAVRAAAAVRTAPSAPATLSENEAATIRQAIAANAGNLTQSARSLGIAKSTLYLKMRRYRISREGPRAARH